MKKQVLIEGVLLLIISLVAMAEGLRLTTRRAPGMLYDPLGPGWYILVLTIALMVLGLYLIVSHRRFLSMEKVAKNKEPKIRIIGMGVVLAGYIFLIEILGYIVASFVFFSLQFRIVGIKSWLINFILTIALVVANYFIFIYYCNMPFPRGIFFE